MDKILVDTFKILRTIGMAFHVLIKDMMRKIINTMNRPKLEYTEIMSTHT